MTVTGWSPGGHRSLLRRTSNLSAGLSLHSRPSERSRTSPAFVREPSVAAGVARGIPPLLLAEGWGVKGAILSSRRDTGCADRP